VQKPGYLTSEFWLVFLTITLTNLGALPVPERFRWVVTLGGILGYALSRALAKVGPATIEVPPLPVSAADVAITPAERGELTKDRNRAKKDHPQ